MIILCCSNDKTLPTKIDAEEPADSSDIHAELQYYLQTYNVNKILVALVEQILTEKPINPHSFAIEYFFSTYTSLAKEAIDRITAKPGVKVE